MAQHRDKIHGRDDPLAYDLEGVTLPQPRLPGETVVTPSEDELLDRVAADLVIHAENCVREFGDFHLALSGGATFDRLYQRLMYDPNYRRLPWRRTHLWFVQEACVPRDDQRSSYRLIRETLGDHADIPGEQFHPIPAESPEAEREYEQQIRDALAWREKGQDRLDYVLLTMDDDGCMTGIHPGSPALSDEEHLVRRSPESLGSPLQCVTMTTSFINAARFVAVLVSGETRASAVDRIAAGRSDDVLPMRGIAPINGVLRWYLDAPACGGAT